MGAGQVGVVEVGARQIEASARGADASLLALRFGLSPDAEARDDEPLTASLLDDLLEASGELLGEPYLSLSLPSALAFRR